MNTTPPPMPHEAIRQLKCVIPFRVRLESPDGAPVGNLNVILESASKAAEEVEFCMGQWMERIAALEAENAKLRDALGGLEEAYCRAGTQLTRDERTTDRKRLWAARAALENTK